MYCTAQCQRCICNALHCTLSRSGLYGQEVHMYCTAQCQRCICNALHCTAHCHVVDCMDRRCMCTALHSVTQWSVWIGGACVLHCTASRSGLYGQEVHMYCTAQRHVVDCMGRRCICTALYIVMYYTIIIFKTIFVQKKSVACFLSLFLSLYVSLYSFLFFLFVLAFLSFLLSFSSLPPVLPVTADVFRHQSDKSEQAVCFTVCIITGASYLAGAFVCSCN